MASVKTIIVTKQDDSNVFDKSCEGHHFDSKFYDTVIREDTDCYWMDTSGNRHIIFKFRKKAMKMPKSKLNAVRELYEALGKKASSRDNQQSFSSQTANLYDDRNRNYRARNNRSKILGYYDRPQTNMKPYFNTSAVCRTTAFTRDHFDVWESSIPFFEAIAMQYKRLAPSHYTEQLKLFEKAPPGMQIGNSPFTTITSNYNWRTACHKDKGDFEGGLGNMTILGDDTYEGGYLGFPQFRIAVDVKPLDFIIMDVHQWHCNTELKADENNVRLSFVCYFRKNMVKCNKKIVIDGEEFYYKDKTIPFMDSRAETGAIERIHGSASVHADNTIPFVDLCAGTGAFSLAFHNTDSKRFKCVFSNDKEKSSEKIYNLNHAELGCKLTCCDIASLDPEKDIPKHSVLCLGFPQQSFKEVNDRNDKQRTNVLRALFDILSIHKPRAILLETRKHLFRDNKGKTYQVFKDKLSVLGYHVKEKVLDTRKVTHVPQHRERFFIVGFRNKAFCDAFDFDFPKIQNRDIVTFLEPKVESKYYYSMHDHSYEELKRTVTKHIRTNTVYQLSGGHISEYKYSCCPTLLPSMGANSASAPLIRDDNGVRRLTPKECFNLQGFSRKYKLPSLCDKTLYRLAGNATSVPVVKLIADQLDQILGAVGHMQFANDTMDRDSARQLITVDDSTEDNKVDLAQAETNHRLASHSKTQSESCTIKKIIVKSKSPVRWIGGKTRFLKEIFIRCPDTMHNYYEPFLGGGSVLIELLNRLEKGEIIVKGEIHVNDKVTPLIDMYRVIKETPDQLIEQLEVLKRMYNQEATNPEKKKEMYTEFRAKYNRLLKEGNDNTCIYQSALFIMLTKSCFSGIYVENSKGECVSGFGKGTNINVYTPENICQLNHLFTKYNVVFHALDFREFLTQQNVSEGDFMYLDPPYYDQTYKKCTRIEFSKSDSDDLFGLCQNDIPRFLMSNSNSPEVRAIFSNLDNFDIAEAWLHRSLKKGRNGNEPNELLIRKWVHSLHANDNKMEIPNHLLGEFTGYWSSVPNQIVKENTELQAQSESKSKPCQNIKQAKPPVQWVGGKSRLLSEIFARFPDSMNNYFEPFLGGGSVLIALLEKLERQEIIVKGDIHVNDKNKALIEMYQVVRTNLGELIGYLSGLKREYNEKRATLHEKKEFFYQCRRLFNQLVSENDEMKRTCKAALFIFLNKTCFNGMYKQNQMGETSCTFGGKPSRDIFTADNIQRLNYLFRKYTVKFSSLNFETVLSPGRIREMDFVYLDPPYYGAAIKYTWSGFSQNEHKALFVLCQRDIPRFLLSNSNTVAVKEIFQGFCDISEAWMNNALKRTHDSPSDAKRLPNELLILKLKDNSRS